MGGRFDKQQRVSAAHFSYMKKHITYILFLWCLGLQAQQYDATWVMGEPNWIYKFDSTSIYVADTIPDSQSLFFFISDGCMSDKNGNLLYYSNGLKVNDRNGHLMEGGDQLALGAFDTTSGYDFLQSPLSLPMPGSDSLYYFFYEAYWDTALPENSRLYYGIIDMHANNGLGRFTTLNNILIDTFISDGGFSACKHANGRDWWLVKPQHHTPVFYKFLVKADGLIEGPFTQNIGVTTTSPDYNTQLVFSPAGDKMFYTNVGGKGELFDFDRCTGMLSNPRYEWTPEPPDVEEQGGAAASFSPSGRYLYITGDSFKLYQLDTYAPDLNVGRVLLARTDLQSSLHHWLSYHQLAPNGKIYINGYHSPTPLSIINYPDSAGLACGLDTFAYDSLPWGTWGMPNFPYYRTPPARAYQAGAGNDTTICYGDTVMLGLPPVDSLTYQWQTTTGLLSSADIAQPLAAPTQTTTYILTITDTVPRGYSCNVLTDTVTVYVIPQPCITGVANIPPGTAKAKMYPNPAGNYINIELTALAPPARLQILDGLGRVVLQQNVTATHTPIPVSHLAPGIYFYKITNSFADIDTGKLVIQR